MVEHKRSIAYLAFDPGFKGAMAMQIDDKPAQAYTYNTDTYARVLYDLSESQDLIVKAYIEGVHSMPRQGVKSVFTFGTNFGIIQGMLIANCIPFTLVNPRLWQKHFEINERDRKVRKSKICERMQEKYPHINFYSERGALLDGISDALAILTYARDVNLKV